MEQLGFNPLIKSMLKDFRADDDGNIYMVDFGTDLGSFDKERTNLWPRLVEDVQTRIGAGNNITNKFHKNYLSGTKSVKNEAAETLTF